MDIPPFCYLFSYFIDNGEDGLHLAWSRDGYQWDALKGGRSFLAPTVGQEKLMRDPCIAQGPDGNFHMVWTDSWNHRTIGYASSPDLVHWSEQRALSLMEHELQARNCWAPELEWDEKRGHWVIFWSTTITGCFPESDCEADHGYNHRIYATTTPDFQSFTRTTLFFDPGFNIIDATLLHRHDGWALIFKDETPLPSPMKNLRVARAADIAGPYVVEPEPLNPPDSWTEGPSALEIGDETIVYFDCYQHGRYGAVRTFDFKSWEDVSDRLRMPPGTRHGAAFKVAGRVVEKLLQN